MSKERVAVDMTRIMELISMQRHDFLNHFQVISGLLQLNRGEQARDYINTTAREIARLSRIVHLKVPEAAVAILLVHYAAAGREVNVVYDVEADLDGCIVPAAKLGPALEKVLLYALECLAPPVNGDRVMYVGIHAADGGYLFRVRFNEQPVKSDRPGDGVLRKVEEELSAFKGVLKQGTGKIEREIVVFLPATQ